MVEAANNPVTREGDHILAERGIPSKPMKCIGKKATFMPMNCSQKCHLPSGSESRRPVILGHQ